MRANGPQGDGPGGFLDTFICGKTCIHAYAVKKWMVWMNDLSIYLAAIVDSGGQKEKCSE
jgi:hypothetical protein